MVDPNNFDDFILELERRQGRHLASIDDRALAEQNMALNNARRYIAD